MDRLEALKIFYAVAERGSFVGAARSLALPPARVSRAIAYLEDTLGLLLFRRSTRAVSLTEEGALYLERTHGAVVELEQAQAAFTGEEDEPAGSLTVTAPVCFGRINVVPAAMTLLERHPRLRVRLRLNDELVSFAEGGIDLAVRIGDLPDSSLEARKLATAGQCLSASPEYLGRFGAPESIRALSAHRIIGFEGLPGALFRWRFAAGTQVSITPVLTVNSAEAAVEAACRGLGIVRCYDYQVERQLRAGELVRLLSSHEPPAVPVHALFPPRQLGRPNLVAFLEALEQQIGQGSEASCMELEA